MKKIGFCSFLLLALWLISCKNESNQSIPTEQITFIKEGEFFFIKTKGDTIHKIDIEIANNDYERETGLMYRDELKKDHGMFFIFDNEAPRSFYMKNTKIPLDLFYIAADSTVVHIIENALPMDESPLTSKKPAQYVLETNAGLQETLNIKVGTKISFKQVNPSL